MAKCKGECRTCKPRLGSEEKDTSLLAYQVGKGVFLFNELQLIFYNTQHS